LAIISNISDKLKIDIKSNLLVNDSEYFEVESLFCEIKENIKKCYLSHLKTSLEDIINDKRKKVILADIEKKKDKIGEKNCENLKKMILLNNYRPFTILLVPIVTKKRATTKMINKSALIIYDPRIDVKQLRVFIAHEFGHIAIREFAGLSRGDNEQYLANLFAFFSILDKDNFYAEECKNLIHKSPEELLSIVANLTI